MLSAGAQFPCSDGILWFLVVRGGFGGRGEFLVVESYQGMCGVCVLCACVCFYSGLGVYCNSPVIFLPCGPVGIMICAFILLLEVAGSSPSVCLGIDSVRLWVQIHLGHAGFAGFLLWLSVC